MKERKDKIKSAFSQSAKTYDTYADIQKGSAEKLASSLSGISPRSVLEIGCATGHYTSMLAQRYPEASIVSLDFADAMVDVARSKFTGRSNVRFVCADAEALLQELNEEFDLITSNVTLQWFEDIKRSLNEIKRLLSPNGIFAGSIFGSQTFQELAQAVDHMYGSPVAIPTQGFLNKYELMSLLNDIFTSVEVEEVNITRGYVSTLQLLRHIKKTGTTGGGSRPTLKLNKTKLKILDDWFEKNYGECTATYQLFFIKAL